MVHLIDDLNFEAIITSGYFFLVCVILYSILRVVTFRCIRDIACSILALNVIILLALVTLLLALLVPLKIL